MLKLSRLDRAEALRYMGVRGAKADANTLELMDRAEEEIFRVSRPAWIFAEIQRDSPALGGNDIQSLLKNCEKVILLAVTLGIGVDRAVRRFQVSDMALAYVLDCMASVAVEQAADLAEQELKRLYPDLHLTRRYSPGYGDYPIERQTEVIRILNAEKKLGLSVTSGCMMNPSKSVTAVIGLCRQPAEGFSASCKNKCEMCNNLSCTYRRRDRVDV